MQALKLAILTTAAIVLTLWSGGCAPAAYHDELVVLVPVYYLEPVPYPVPVEHCPRQTPVASAPASPTRIKTTGRAETAPAAATKTRERQPTVTRGQASVVPAAAEARRTDAAGTGRTRTR